MPSEITLENVIIRTEIKPGDFGTVIHRQALIYAEEYNYNVFFEAYVAKGLAEFYLQYDSDRDRAWICEHDERIVGFVLLMHESTTVARLRFFYLEKEYRGIGLGKKLMLLFMNFFEKKGYTSSYLTTTHELESAAALYKRHGFVLTKEWESTVFGKKLMEQRYDLNI